MMQTYIDFAPEVRDLIDRIPASSIYANSVCDMEYLENLSNGPVVVLGDAAHSMTPSIGRGANVGLEDAAEISNILIETLGTDDGNNNKNVKAIHNVVNLRQDRVREIHTASRMHALNKNKQDTTLGSFRKRDPAFFERLYGSEPSKISVSAN